MPFPVSNPQVTIASGQSLSPSFYVGVGDIQGIGIPGSWTAATLSFQFSVDNVTFYDLHDDAGAEITVSATAGKMSTTVIDSTSAPWMKIRSGTGGSPVAQAADRVLSVMIRKRMPPI